jgi:hypothetical protein
MFSLPWPYSTPIFSFPCAGLPFTAPLLQLRIHYQQATADIATTVNYSDHYHYF